LWAAVDDDGDAAPARVRRPAGAASAGGLTGRIRVRSQGWRVDGGDLLDEHARAAADVPGRGWWGRHRARLVLRRRAGGHGRPRPRAAVGRERPATARSRSAGSTLD